MLFSTRKALCALRDELDDHREAINSNSADAADVFELVSKLDAKIETLSMRLDELYLLLGADAELSATEAALQAYLQVPRSRDALEAFTGASTVSLEHSLRVLLLKGVTVHQFIEDGVAYFTTNIASKNNVQLNQYF